MFLKLIKDIKVLFLEKVTKNYHKNIFNKRIFEFFNKKVGLVR